MVEGTGLENRQAGDRLVGSNPTASAIDFAQHFADNDKVERRVYQFPNLFPHLARD